MTQKQAQKIMLSGKNVFLTGPPGAGKTYVLQKFIEAAEDKGKRVAVTASTGIAASHIGGVTIHSWSGLGISEELTKSDLLRFDNNRRVAKRLNKADVLVIDEVSMLHGHRLDMVNVLTKHMRGSEQPFGGLQVILVGDLYQLPPVSRDSDEPDFVHFSESWRELDLTICYLTEQHRQETNDGLLDLLEAMRRNELSAAHRNLLQTRIGIARKSELVVTRLYSHNIDVDRINDEHLAVLKAKIKRFTMTTSGDKYRIETLRRGVLAPSILELKVGAEVMFVANDFEEGFVNGTRGVVVGFNKKKGWPVVKLLNGRKLTVGRHTWSIKEDERVLAEITQVPLRLAWAITIHKSQGMSLDGAEVDLSKAFTPGMGYVALSRVRALDGLFIQGINEMALTMHPGIYEVDLLLREKSEATK